MAKIPRGILGGFKGKIANVVGASWKGIAYMRSLALSVANPQTAAQIAQRTRFSNVVAFAKETLATMIKPLWDRFQTGQSGFNAFVSANIDLFDAAQADPPEDLVISVGKMAETEISSLSISTGPGTVTVNWVDDSGEGFKLAADKAYALVVNRSDPEIKVQAEVNVRSDTSTIVLMPDGITAGDVFDVYLAFRRADGTVVSNTSYATDTA